MTSSAENRQKIMEAAHRIRLSQFDPITNKGFLKMTLDEQIKEAEQKLANLKAEKERLRTDVDISECWPCHDQIFLTMYGSQIRYKPYIEHEVFKNFDVCFRDEEQRQRAIRWHKIDKLWKHLARESYKDGGISTTVVFAKITDRHGDHINITTNHGCLPITYIFRTIGDAKKALECIGQENLLFWFRGWEEA